MQKLTLAKMNIQTAKQQFSWLLGHIARKQHGYFLVLTPQPPWPQLITDDGLE